MRSRRPERGEALKFKMNVHRRLKMMAFVTEQAQELPPHPALLRAKRLRYHRTGIRVSFLCGAYWLGLPLTPTGRPVGLSKWCRCPCKHLCARLSTSNTIQSKVNSSSPLNCPSLLLPILINGITIQKLES